MSIRSVLKAYFETNDLPTEAEFADLIDSCTNEAEDTPAKRNRAAPTISANVLDIDFGSKNDFKTTSEVAATAAFAITISNATNADIATIDLFITNTIIITLPSGSLMEDSETRWVGTPTFELTIEGGVGKSFELSLNKVGSKYKWVMSQIFE